MRDKFFYNVCMKGSIYFRKDRGTRMINEWNHISLCSGIFDLVKSQLSNFFAIG